MAEMLASRILRQARSSVTELLSSGGWSKSRSEIWARMFWMYMGGSKPKRSSIRWVSSLMAPMRTALYSRGVSETRVGHGGDNGVGIRIAVSADVDVVHRNPLKSVWRLKLLYRNHAVLARDWLKNSEFTTCPFLFDREHVIVRVNKKKGRRK